MNKVYKVVWSKVKNCYVVVSEIAKNVIHGNVKNVNVSGGMISYSGFTLGVLMPFMLIGNVSANSIDTIQVKDGYTVTCNNNVLKVAYDGTYETIVDKKSFILENNKNLNDLIIGGITDDIKIDDSIEIDNAEVLGTYSLSADGSLNVSIDADDLVVGGNVQATTFNGVKLNEALYAKVGKATTLEGYGITDTYTQAEVDAKIVDATNGLLSGAKFAAVESKTQNISSNTAPGKTSLIGDLEVSGNLEAKTFNGMNLAIFTETSEVYSTFEGIADRNYVDTELVNLNKSFQVADIGLESIVTNAYQSADSMLEADLTNAYQSADMVLSGRIAGNEESITLLNVKVSELQADGGFGYVYADEVLEAGLTDAYQASDNALEVKLTDAYQVADEALKVKLTDAYQVADEALESKVTKAFQAADKALESKVAKAYKAADKALESKVAKAYKAADKALESKVIKAYQTADNTLSNRVSITEKDIRTLTSSFTQMTSKYKAADKALESKVAKAYKAADKALESKVIEDFKEADALLVADLTDAYQTSDIVLEVELTDAYQTLDVVLETALNDAYQVSDIVLESVVTDAYQVADVALEAKLTDAYQVADEALETKLTNLGEANIALANKVSNAYQAADEALESKVVKAYQAADEALETKLTKAMVKKADRATTLAGYGITDAYTKTEVDKKVEYKLTDDNVEMLKNATQNISGDTTEGITIMNGEVQVYGNVVAHYGNFFTGATFANDAVRIDSDGVVRIGGSGNDANVVIYNEGATSIDATGSVVGGALVSKGNVEASGNIISTNGDVMAGDISLRETAEAVSNKADKATTLEGYGITDAYTKAEIDSKFEGKVDASDVYSKTDFDNKLADVSAELSGKADTAYVDSNFAKADDVYTKEEADATFVKRTEVMTIDENGNVVTGTKTEVGENFVVENTSNGSTVTINEGQKGQVVFGDDGKVIFGQNSAWYEDGVGFFVGRTELTKGHDKDNANAAIMDDGRLMAAGGKFAVETDGSMSVAGGNFTVDADGDVKAKTYNGIELDKFVQNSQEEISGLNQRLGKLSGKVNKVGAGAAALAALHPLEYDPDDKLTFSAGVGNYSGTNAAAIGAFYRPDEKFMVSLGGTMGNGENMVNVGLVIGLDGAKETPKLSRKELIQIIDDLQAETESIELESQILKADNEVIKAENENIKSEVSELRALISELVNKK